MSNCIKCNKPLQDDEPVYQIRYGGMATVYNALTGLHKEFVTLKDIEYLCWNCGSQIIPNPKG